MANRMPIEASATPDDETILVPSADLATFVAATSKRVVPIDVPMFTDKDRLHMFLSRKPANSDVSRSYEDNVWVFA